MTTFKQIKVHLDNRTAIVAALQKANGIAAAHTLRTFAAVEQLADDAEARLVDLIGSRTRAVGAQLRYTSGDPVAKSYRYSRRATKIILERRASGWFITSIRCVDVYPDDGGDAKLWLTPAQAVAAVALVRKKFAVIKPKVSEPAVTEVDTDVPEAPSGLPAALEVSYLASAFAETPSPIDPVPEASESAHSQDKSTWLNSSASLAGDESASESQQADYIAGESDADSSDQPV